MCGISWLGAGVRRLLVQTHASFLIYPTDIKVLSYSSLVKKKKKCTNFSYKKKKTIHCFIQNFIRRHVRGENRGLVITQKPQDFPKLQSDLYFKIKFHAYYKEQ